MCKFCEKKLPFPPLVRDACPELLIGANNIEFIREYFCTKQDKIYTKFTRQERALAKKIYHKLTQCGLMIDRVNEFGDLMFRYVPSKRLPNGEWEEEFNLCPDKVFGEKSDPHFKEKREIVILVSKGKMSIDLALETMADLNGESPLPPIANVPEIPLSDIPF